MFPIMLVKSSKLSHLFQIVKRTKTSALYIIGDKARETFAFLTPHLDFDERIQDRPKLERNLKLRGSDLNLDEIVRMWNFYKHIDSKKGDLEESRASISQTIKNLLKHGSRYEQKIENLKAHGKMVKEDLRVLKESVADVEEKAALRILMLPNELHDKAPELEPVVNYTYLEKPERSTDAIFHLDVAKQLELVEYTSPSCYYLQKEAALFELASTFYFSDLLRQKKYTQFSNADFARSVIVEGCGIDFSDPKQVFTLKEPDSEHKHENSRLHLTGGASFPAFMAYFAKHFVQPTCFPLLYYTIGRQYHPQTDDSKSLLNVTQTTAVSIFGATKQYAEMESQFEDILKDVVQIYETLGYHFQITFTPIKNLHYWESLRASIQMFSPHLNDYVEIGNISMCGDYVSKRLLFNYGKGYDISYPYVITGTLLNVPKLLACILESENFAANKLLPELLQKYVV